MRGIILVSQNLNMTTIDSIAIDIVLHDTGREKNTQISSQTQTFLTKYDRNTHVSIIILVSATFHMILAGNYSDLLYYPFCISLPQQFLVLSLEEGPILSFLKGLCPVFHPE